MSHRLVQKESDELFYTSSVTRYGPQSALPAQVALLNERKKIVCLFTTSILDVTRSKGLTRVASRSLLPFDFPSIPTPIGNFPNIVTLRAMFALSIDIDSTRFLPEERFYRVSIGKFVNNNSVTRRGRRRRGVSARNLLWYAYIALYRPRNKCDNFLIRSFTLRNKHSFYHTYARTRARLDSTAAPLSVAPLSESSSLLSTSTVIADTRRERGWNLARARAGNSREYRRDRGELARGYK